MIYLVCALYAEAAPFIRRLHLKREDVRTSFQEFSDGETTRLLITGVGQVQAAVAIGSLCERYRPTAKDLLVLVGSCASLQEEVSKGSLYLCNTLVDEGTGRTFYPDLLQTLDLPEAQILTGAKLLSQSQGMCTKGEGIELYDMEAAAVYQAGSYFFAPHQMLFLKVVSDAGTADTVTREALQDVMEQQADNILAQIEQMHKSLQKEDLIWTQKEEELAQKWCQDLCCSKTMQASMMQKLRYICLSKDWEELEAWMEDKYERGELPVSSRKYGKQWMEQFREWEPKKSSTKDEKISTTPYTGERFSHIYVEKRVKNHPRTKQILDKFPKAKIVWIDHYKDVFCRRGQSFGVQQKGQNLILAQKEGRLVYEGAKVCPSFGNEYFYYTSCVMNCIYDCEYCYLKGMYPSGHMVIFVNLEDIFAELELILKQHRAYVCVSYDTDLIGIDAMTGFVDAWEQFTRAHENLYIEIRTKCGRMDVWEKEPCPRVIYAFTMSPQRIVENCEKRTADRKSVV